MSEDTFTEVTNESWLGRIGGAIKGIVIGLVFFIGFWTLFSASPKIQVCGRWASLVGALSRSARVRVTGCLRACAVS